MLMSVLLTTGMAADDIGEPEDTPAATVEPVQEPTEEPAAAPALKLDGPLKASADYTITIDPSEHIAVTADKSMAAENDTVKLTVTPDTGYEVDTLTIQYGESSTLSLDPYELNRTQRFYSFTMPASNVTVTATVKVPAVLAGIKATGVGPTSGHFPSFTSREAVFSSGSGDVEIAWSALYPDPPDPDFTPWEKDSGLVDGETYYFRFTIQNTKANDHSIDFSRVSDFETYSDVTLDGFDVSYYHAEPRIISDRYDGAWIYFKVTKLAAPATYTVTVSSVTNGTVTADKTSDVTAGDTVTLTVTPDTGYELDALIVRDDGGNLVTVSGNSFTMPAANVNVEASFKAVAPATYTVTFETNGGSAAAAQTVTGGGKATKPADPIKESYTFEGWYEDAAFAKEFDFTAPITADVTVYAKWTEDSVTPELATYSFISGDGQSWTKGSDNTVDFTVKRDVDDETTFSHFTGVEIDGTVVDAANYTAEAGSVKLSLKASYLETLADGSHDISVLFDDGSAEAKFTVLDSADNDEPGDETKDNTKQGSSKKDSGTKKDSSKESKSPKTGDQNSIVLWGTVMCVSVAGVFVSLFARSNKKSRK